MKLCIYTWPQSQINEAVPISDRIYLGQKRKALLQKTCLFKYLI